LGYRARDLRSSKCVSNVTRWARYRSADAYYGASTQRAVDNFPISDLRFGKRFIWALGLIKGSAAEMNKSMGHVDADKADAIMAAAQESTTISSSSTSSRPARVPRRT